MFVCLFVCVCVDVMITHMKLGPNLSLLLVPYGYSHAMQFYLSSHMYIHIEPHSLDSVLDSKIFHVKEEGFFSENAFNSNPDF